MDLKRLSQVVRSLSANGANGYVRVAAPNPFTLGQIVSLTSTGPNDPGLQVSDVQGFSGTTEVAVYLIDPATGAPFNALGYTLATTPVITALEQTLWVGFGEDGVVKDVFTDTQMQNILLAVLPGAATPTANVAVTNFPASQPVSVLTLPLPTGAATETTLGSILTALGAGVAVSGTFWQATQPISAAALPLPTGAATEATLAAASAKLPATLGQKTMVASLAVTLASDQSALAVSAAALPLPAGAATQTTLASILTALGGALTAVVSGTVAVSNLPATQPISAVALPLPTGAATSAAQTDGSQKTQVTNFPATQPVSAVALPLPAGAATAAAQTDGSQKTAIVGHTVVDPANSSSTPLVGGGVFVNTPGTNVMGYSTITGSLFTDVPGTLYVEEGPDGTHWDESEAHVAVPGVSVKWGHTIDSQYYRMRYVNGGAPQGAFRLQTILSQNGVSGEMAHLSVPVSDFTHAQLVKAVLTGKTPPSEASVFQEVHVSTDGAMSVETANTQGAFGGLVTISEIAHASFKAPFGINGRTCVQTTASGGAISWVASVVTLHTNLNAAGLASIQTREAVRYTPGQGNTARFAPVFSTGITGSRQEIGFLTDTDGFGFGFNGTQFGILIRKGGADTWIPQGAWNGDDKFDGTGPSGEVYNPLLGSPMQIQMQWLGFGAIRFFLESAVTGDFVLVHTHKFANSSTTPSILQPSLPVRAKVVNVGSVTDVHLSICSMAALTEGALDVPGEDVRFSFQNFVANVPITGATLFTLRNKATNIFGGVNVNTIIAHVDFTSLRVQGASDGYVHLILNPTLGGAPAFADLSTATSVIQTDTAGTYTPGTGTILFTICLNGNSSMTETLKDYDIHLTPGDTLMVLGFSETGTPGMRGSLSWHEEN